MPSQFAELEQPYGSGRVSIVDIYIAAPHTASNKRLGGTLPAGPSGCAELHLESIVIIVNSPITLACKPVSKRFQIGLGQLCKRP